MAPEPLIKVVVTTYNRRDWTAAAIDSVLAQTYSNLHIVIVDDASTDGSAELAHEYAAAHQGRFTVVAKRSNRGVADSIRLGIEAGPESDYVAFLNDDDLWRRDKVERQIELFKRSPDAGLAFTGAEIIDTEGELVGQTYAERYAPQTELGFWDILSMSGACASTLMLNRATARRVAATLPDVITWDYYFVLVAAGTSRVVSLDANLGLYRVSAGAIHLGDDILHRDIVRTREQVFARNPCLANLVGGDRARRQRLAVLALSSARMKARQRRWREYFWHGLHVIRQRRLRPVVWLVIYAVDALRHPMADRPSA
jgi:glycosyltransferase involved in cell wall biosynthesis